MNGKYMKQILFFTRPSQVLFHIELEKSLREILGDIPVKFVTFFSWAREKAEAAGYECIYIPEELRKVSGTEITNERFSEIDRYLYESQGANFNLMLQSERFLPKDGRDVELFGRKHLVVLDRLVIDETLLISTLPDHFVYWLAGALANSRGGAHLSFCACGLPPGRVIAFKTMWKTWSVPFEGDAEAFLKECRERLYTPGKDRIEYLKPQKLPPLYKRLKQRYHELKCEERDSKAGSYFPGSKLVSLQTIKNRLPQSWFKYPEPDYDIKTSSALACLKDLLCYLPLHMEPESTILMFSPWLRDQIEMCRLISQALPVGWKILVKENLAMKGMRPLDYYRKLKALPNVVLVSPEVNSTSLVLAARVTVTLTGTASNEAAILGKPSIALGRSPGLRLLSAGDISAHLLLNDLFKILQQQEYKLDLNDWITWISGSFKAKAIPVFNDEGVLCIPYDKQNIEAYTNYIKSALKFSD
ncbi:MAG: hypothetical protein ABIN18_19025 [Pseudomonadota bacterium]